MSNAHNLFNTLQKFDPGNGKQANFYSLPALEAAGVYIADRPSAVPGLVKAAMR